MDEISGLVSTGRRLRGPASDLVELNGENGLRHTAIVFHDEYLEHRALNESFELVRGFLESPWVTGLVELSDRQGSAFVYPCGECWSVAEVSRILADLGQVGGVRAGLELMYCAGRILVEAGEAGESEGVYSHGGLTPWRIMIRRDGQVLVLGHALPQVEILMFHEDGQRIPREDSFRYCPPERIEQGPEDVSSDLFGLALIGFELMTGRPVYDGLVNDIRQQAARGEGSRRLFRFRDKLPDVVRECLTVALRRDVADRYESGPAFLAAVQEALAAPEVTGSSLMDLMAHVTRQDRRSGSRPDSASTMMASVAEVRSMTGVSVDSSKDESARWSSSRTAEKPKSRPPMVKPEKETGAIPSAPALIQDADGSASELRASSPASVPDAPVIPERVKGKTRPSRRSPRRSPSSTASSADGAPKLQNSQELVQSILGESSQSTGQPPRFEKGRVSRGRTRPETASGPSPRESLPSSSAQPADVSTPSPSGLKTASPRSVVSKTVGESPIPPPPIPKRSPSGIRSSKSKPMVESGRDSNNKGAIRSSKLEDSGDSPARSSRPAPSIPKPPPKPAPKVKSVPKRVKSAKSSSSVLITREVSPKARVTGAPPPEVVKPSIVNRVGLTEASSVESNSSEVRSQAQVHRTARTPTKAKAPVTPPTQAKVTAKPKTKPVPAPKVVETVQPEEVDTESMRTAMFSRAELKARLLADESSDSPTEDDRSTETTDLWVQFSDSTKPERISVSSDWTIDRLIQSWMWERLRIRTDLTGRVKGWPRLYRGEQRLLGITSVSDLADGPHLKLGWVSNQEVMVDLSVKQASGDQRVLTPMASAIPMGILLDYLRDWLNLDDGPLQVTADGRRLGLSEILADLESKSGRISLTVERVDPQ